MRRSGEEAGVSLHATFIKQGAGVGNLVSLQLRLHSEDLRVIYPVNYVSGLMHGLGWILKEVAAAPPGSKWVWPTFACPPLPDKCIGRFLPGAAWWVSPSASSSGVMSNGKALHHGDLPMPGL